MKKPVSTKCGHQFCGFCLREFLKTKKSVPCPLCKEPVTKRSLVDRPHLSEIVDNVRSLVTAVELDIGHFSPERGLQLNFLPSTPEELPTSRQTRGSKRKEKEEPVTTPQDVRTKRRKSDTTGLCQGHLTKQPTRRSDTTGQGQQRSNTTDQGQPRLDITDQGQQRSNTSGQGQQRLDTTDQGQQRSNTTGQGLQKSNKDQSDLTRNPSTEKHTREMRSNDRQHLLEEIKRADMKSVSPETHSVPTGDTQTVGGSGKKTKDLSHPEQSPSRITRSRQKSADCRQTRNSTQDCPDNDNLLQYLANESCGAMETKRQDRPETDQNSCDPLLVDIRYGSSDDNSDVDMIYSNVTEEKIVCEEENIIENEEPVGKDLISLGKKTKMLKDKIHQAGSVTGDGINDKDGTSGSEVKNATSSDVVQQEKDGNLNSNNLNTTTSIDMQYKENSEYRPKKKMLFRKKQKTGVQEEEVIQLSGTSSGGSCHGIFDKRNSTRTYGKKQDSKLEKDRIVKKWLKSASPNVDEFADANSMPVVETQTGEISLASATNMCVVGENVTSSGVGNPLKLNVSVDQEAGLVVNSRKKIFKTKLDHPVGVATTVQHVNGKGKFVVRKVSPVRVEQTLEKSKWALETKSGEKWSDPYEFKPSQKTPKTSKGKKKVLVKKDAKKCRKHPINIQIGDSTATLKEKEIDLTLQAGSREDMQGSRSSLRSRSKENIEDSFNHCSSRRKKQSKVKSHGVLPQGTEDVEKIIEELNQAEAFDLVTCTQEAKDQIVENRNNSPQIAEERTGDGERSDGERSDEERCMEPGIESLDKIKDTQVETDIRIVNHDHPQSATNNDKVLAAIQTEMDNENKKCDDSEFATSSVNMIADTCTEKNTDTESRKCDHPKSSANSVDMISDTETSTLQHTEPETAHSIDVPDTQLEDLPGSHGKIPPPPVSHKAVMSEELQGQSDSGAEGKCRRKKQDVEGSQGQVAGRVSTEGDAEYGSLVSDASCVPNTDDSVVSRRTKKLRNSLKCRKSVTFTDKVQHILDHDNSQGHAGRETRGGRSMGSESRGHSQGQLDRGTMARGQRSKENLIQALQQNGLSSPGTGSQQVTMAEIQCIQGEPGQNDDHSHRTKRHLSQGNVNDATNSCIADTLPDKMGDSRSLGNGGKSGGVERAHLHSPTSRKNTEEEMVAVHSQTFDPEQEFYTESEMLEDRIPDTDAETVHPCGENTLESVSTQPPSDDLQFGVRSGSNGISESSSFGKNSRGNRSRKTRETLPDKSPLVVMETQMSGSASSGCETLGTQESVSLLVGNDLGRIEKPEAELAGTGCVTAEKQPDNSFTKISSKRLSQECSVEHSHNGKAEEDSVQLVSQRNKLKRQSPRMKSHSLTSPQLPGYSATKKKPSCQDDKPSSGVVCAESEVIRGEHSTTSSGSTVIPATALASRDSTQIIQICKMENEPPRRGNKKNNVINMSTDTSASGNVNDMSLSEVSTENSKSRKLRSSSRSLEKCCSKEEVIQQRFKESEAVWSQQGTQGQQNGQGQKGIQGHDEKENDKPSESDINQNTVQEEIEERATKLVDAKLKTDESVDLDDLTPTLKPVKKGHNRTRVTRQTCSPEDIFVMDSETMASGQASSVVQNQEGVINLTSLQLLDPSQPQSLDKDTELSDCGDSEHSVMETSQSIEILDEKMNEVNHVQDKKLCVEEQEDVMMEKYKMDEKEVVKEQGNVKMTDEVGSSRSKGENSRKEVCKRHNDSDPDSDLSQSQSRQTRETGVRCKRGLATRKWQLESQTNSCETSASSSKERDSLKSPGRPSCDEQNSRKKDKKLVSSDDFINKEIPVKTQSLLNDSRTVSDNLNMISLKEKFKKTFKKCSSRSPNLNRVIGSFPKPEHSPHHNHTVQQKENGSLVSDEDEMETPDIVDKAEQKSESVIVIQDSFPCSRRTTKEVNSSRQTGKSHSANLVQRSSDRKRGKDSPKMSASQESAEDKLHLSSVLDKSETDETDETSSFEGQRSRVMGRKQQRPVIEESEDEMCDASSPLPDVVLNGCQQTCTDKDPDLMNVSLESAHSEGEDRAEEPDNDKEGTTVIAESDEERNNDYSSSEESDSGRRLNLTSSSAFSSQSEAMTTQNRKALEKDLEKMKRDIAELEKQLANKPNQNGRSTPQSSSKRKDKKPNMDLNKEQVVSEDSDKERVVSEDSNEERVLSKDSDSDLVLEVDGDGLNDGSEGDLYDGMIDLVTSSPVIKTSQGSRFIEVEDGMADWHEGDDLFLSPLPPSPPPTPSQPGKRPPSKLSQDQAPILSSPCGNTGPLKEELTSPKTDDVDHNSQSRQRGFVTTGLTYLQTREIQKLALQNDDKFYAKFNPSITHVIVKTVPQGGRVCERTLKFFQGMAHQCWVLDYQWIADSKGAGHLLPEDKYEIVGDTITGNCHYGPRQSRLSSQPLFDGFHFFCLGTSDSLTTENLQELIERCGGTVVDHPSAFPPDTKLNLAITCIDLEDEDDLPSPEDTRSFNKLHKRFGLLTVSREWVLDSLTVYTVQPLKEYVLTTVRHIQIPDLVLGSKTS
ncbi:Breast cancer type 1 susceptibility protein-like [Mizuhopecten yessoensis]|uniref:RING-type E3 ubiquitin transferase BRCA1 n=2 Tax=Mizuhopecten yessoensis TaxID=6573 RepID=A0A210QT19_MIZYE|nr:Breast cancer type 1 susceptibility protein-like [Mizuhopecten yessoensis]